MTNTVTDRASRDTTTAGTQRRGLLRGRLLVFAAIILSALTLRIAVTAFTPLAERIGDDIGFSAGVIGVFGMVPTLMFAVSGVSTPLLVSRLGLERTALTAMVATGLGSLIRATMGGTVGLLAFSAVALAGMGIGNVVIPPLVKRYFSDRVAMMSALYITMVQLGTVIPALITVPVADVQGWRFSLGMWALLGFLAVLPWVGLLRAGSRGNTRADRGMAESEQEPTGQVWRSPVAWGMAGMFGMTSLSTYAVFTWLPAIFTDAGASDAFGGSMVALFAVVGLVAALTAPTVAARLHNPFPIVIGCALCFFVAFAGLLLAPMSMPILWVVVLGLGPSTFPMALTLINLRTRTQAGSAALSGFTQGGGYAVACAGPVLFGALHTATDGWVAPFGMLCVAVLVLLVAAWHACKPRMLEDSWVRG